MTKAQAQKLKVGERVIWNGDSSDGGTVLEVWHHGVLIRWDSGLEGGLAFDHCREVSRPS